MNFYEVRPRGRMTTALEMGAITSFVMVVIGWSWFGRAAGWW